MPAAKVRTLLRLLDDQNDSVRDGVAMALLDYHGDVSDQLLAEGLNLNNQETQLLSERLHPGRQAALRAEWVVPFGPLNSPEGDWDGLEALLRLLSDYLHDGVSVRPSLSDSLDLLTAELSEQPESPEALARLLFGPGGPLTGNRMHPYDPRNADLAWCIENGQSNPLGLSLIYSLVGRRLGLEIYGCNYPGHFLSLINLHGAATLVDCFHGARLTVVPDLLRKHPEISEKARFALSQPCTLLAMLRRLLANLHLAFDKAGRQDDAELLYELLVPFGESED